MKPTPSLVAYIETEIIPGYEAFDKAHGIDHVRTVIRQSLTLARHCRVETDMVYAIAAYHDTGLVAGRERHHLVSAEILAADEMLRTWFTPQQIRIMCEAVEDHRASATHAPRSIYGRIVAEADRCIDAETILRRTVQYGLAHAPELDREGQYGRCLEHLRNKYAEGGYLRLWMPRSDNARRLEELRTLIRDRAALRSRFEEIYDRETADEEESPSKHSPANESTPGKRV